MEKNKVIEINKTNAILIGVGLIIIVILVSILTTWMDTLYKPDPYKSKIDSLNIELKYIRNNQIALDNKIKSYKDSILKFDRRIDSLNIELTETRNYYGKKIKDITSWNHTELNQFFTDRYK
jgi:peptidoglycan hydrolase CwlO-like protein